MYLRIHNFPFLCCAGLAIVENETDAATAALGLRAPVATAVAADDSGAALLLLATAVATSMLTTRQCVRKAGVQQVQLLPWHEDEIKS